MAKIVNPRPFAASGVRNSTPDEQSSKPTIDGPDAERTTTRRRKENRIRRPVFKITGILAQSVHQGQGGRNQPIFAELSLANRDDALIEVDVSNTQFQYFIDTEPASIQEPENFRHNEVPQGGTRRGLKRVDCMKELSKFFVGQHSGYKRRQITGSQCGVGNVGRITGSR